MIIELWQPISVLMSAGYKQNENGGWIKIGSSRFRFHAYIVSGCKINLHIDKLFYDKNGNPYHSSKGTIKIGWHDLLKCEAKKLKKL